MKKWMFFIAMSVSLYACNTLKLTTDFDKTVDFSAYQTVEFHGWDQGGDLGINRFDKQKIEKAFAEEFEKRGFKKGEQGEGEMVVSLHVVSQQKTTTTANSYYGYGGYYAYGPMHRWGPGYATTSYHTYDYNEGTLVVSLYDAEKEELIWQTAGTATIDWGDRKNEKAIKYIVSRMMMQFPKG